jgi:hypothetical protein
MVLSYQEQGRRKGFRGPEDSQEEDSLQTDMKKEV